MAAAAAAVKLAVAPGAAPTTATVRHRACAPIAVSSAPPVTVSFSSATHKHEAAATSAAAPPTTGSGTSEAATLASPPPLATMWREVHGAGDWRGLVAPLHPVLRGEIVRYGELVATCYRAFDLDQHSKRYLNCKHGMAQMLRAYEIPIRTEGCRTRIRYGGIR
ncbi:unnamed protein product [Urochloa humidicola]